jgi:hypothetical protein
MFGLILAGEFWPFVYPRLIELADREFKRRKKEKTP